MLLKANNVNKMYVLKKKFKRVILITEHRLNILFKRHAPPSPVPSNNFRNAVAVNAINESLRYLTGGTSIERRVIWPRR